MGEALTSVGAVTLFVDDPQRSKSFYANAFGLESIFEDANSVVFRFENLIVNLLNVSAAPDLIGPAIVADRDSGSRFQFTIWVDDTDAVIGQLAACGISLLNGPIDRAWGLRTASFADPDGHIWEIAHAIADKEAAGD